MIHGLAVMAMVILHLFDNLEYGRMYSPVLYLLGKPPNFYLHNSRDFCVMGFAFLLWLCLVRAVFSGIEMGI